MLRIYLLILAITSATCAASAQVADVLSYMLSASESPEPAETASTTIGNSDDNMSGVLSLIASSSPAKPSQLSPLDYITGAYQSGSYHHSGVMSGVKLSDMGSLTIHPGHRGTIYTPGWGEVTSGFGFRKKFGRMHYGIDVSMGVGDTVCAPLPGRVKLVKYDPKGYGHYVVMAHEGGMETRYAHLSVPLVSMGDYVTTGEPIALSGSSGNSTGPHLHFETRYMGKAVDPRTVFDFSSGFPAAGVMPSAGSEKSALNGKRTYVVRPGDTIDDVARKTGLTTMRLCQLNFISEDSPLNPGTMLIVR